MEIADDKLGQSIDDLPLTQAQKELIFNSEEAMRGFAYPQETFPEGTYLRLFTSAGQFCGAIRLELTGLIVQHHLLLLPYGKHDSRQLCELSVIYSRLHGWFPFTTVFDKPELTYMHNFLRRLGYTSKDVPVYEFTAPLKVYSLPIGWQPKTVREFSVQY